MTYLQHQHILDKGRFTGIPTHRQYVRAAYKLLSAQGKSNAGRDSRHLFIRKGFKYLAYDANA